MNPLAWSALGLAGAFALGNLVAVVRADRHVEYITKPAVMVMLITTALLLQPVHQPERGLFVLALGLGLAGDVLLMLPRDFLVRGLVAFLCGHLAYIAGFRFGALSATGAVIGVVVALGAATLLLGRITAGLERSGRARLKGPVLIYVVVISLMTVSATASGSLVAAAGGILFLASDAVFAWYRFVDPVRWGRPANIVLYQVGQALLVLSLSG